MVDGRKNVGAKNLSPYTIDPPLVQACPPVGGRPLGPIPNGNDLKYYDF